MTALRGSGVARTGLATLLVCLSAVLAGPAAAGSKPPPPLDVAAIAVYVETLPTSSGSVVAGQAPSAPGGSVPARLPAQAVTALEQHGGEDAGLLERVATAPELGAPQRIVPPVAPRRTRTDKAARIPRTGNPARIPKRDGGGDPERTALPAIDISLSDGSSRIPWLLAALALITLASTGAWAARRQAR